MNKPKWLELIWILCWLAPPIILAAIVGRTFQLDHLAYLATAALLIAGWFTSIIWWSRSLPTEHENEDKSQNADYHAMNRSRRQRGN